MRICLILTYLLEYKMSPDKLSKETAFKSCSQLSWLDYLNRVFRCNNCPHVFDMCDMISS